MGGNELIENELMRKAFSNNLKYYMKLFGVTQSDVIRDLKIPSATISSWVNGKRLPRMSKIEALANYLGITKSDLIDRVVIGSFDTESEARAFARDLANSPDIMHHDNRSFYNKNDSELTRYYNKLNNDGQIEAVKRVEELTYIPKYKKDPEK